MSATTLKLKQKRSKDRRARIVAAATRLFSKRGIAGTSLTEVARLARVPLPTDVGFIFESPFCALYAQAAVAAESLSARPHRRSIPESGIPPAGEGRTDHSSQ